MLNFQKTISQYLDYCNYQKNLNFKTLKAYSIDIKQFSNYMTKENFDLNRNNLSNFITFLHKNYKPKSVKRKIASVKAFFKFLEYEEIININPFNKLDIKYKAPVLLPKTISKDNLELIFKGVYSSLNAEDITEYKRKVALRNIAAIELLFSAGLRVSELCCLKIDDIDLSQGLLRIYGKGAKERIIVITNINVIQALENYINCINTSTAGFLFINRLGNKLSEQSVRFMIYNYANAMHISEKITPHMFRHTFATMLLEEDVDIRYIQQILGHSSILTTQIYTHVASKKQRDILTLKNPRNKINMEENC